jgi:hypothetical protein
MLLLYNCLANKQVKKKNQDPGSGINIPDPPHWYLGTYVVEPFICVGKLLLFFQLEKEC